MRKNKTFQKDGENKLRDTIQKLKIQLSRLRKENQLLREELENLDKTPKSSKIDKPSKEVEDGKEENWRSEFLQKFKPGKLRNKKKIDE